VSNVLALVLVVLGLLVLAVILIRVLRVLRRFNQTVSMVATNTQDRTGLLRARSAALRAAGKQRRESGKPVTSHPDAE
jgi:Tfp pilus assembly protein PilX